MREQRTSGRSGLWLLWPALVGLSCGSSALNNQCSYGGQSHAVGDSFSSTDGCNSCSCTTTGVACTLRACLSDAGTDAQMDANVSVDAGSGDGDGHGDAGNVTDAATGCALDRTYTFGNDGGFVSYKDASTLSPARLHIMTRDHFTNALPRACSRQLACVDAAGVDVTEIQQALAHPDVVAALAMTTRILYGTDPRPVDGTVFVFERDDQRGFTVGSGPTVPAGLRALADLLIRLQVETAATAECANL